MSSVEQREGLDGSWRLRYGRRVALHLTNLDGATRDGMLAELDQDEAVVPPDDVYLSPRLSPLGATRYRALLREAIVSGDDQSLESGIAQPGMLNSSETSIRRGKPVTSKMNSRAAQTMAEGEFNRYYIRGLCRRALAAGMSHVEVYRARASSWARPESEALIGSQIPCDELLEDLRTHIGTEPTLLPDVNSGLSVRLIQ